MAKRPNTNFQTAAMANMAGYSVDTGRAGSA